MTSGGWGQPPDNGGFGGPPPGGGGFGGPPPGGGGFGGPPPGGGGFGGPPPGGGNFGGQGFGGPPPGGGGFGGQGFGGPPGGYGPPPGMPPGWQPTNQGLESGIPWESPGGGLLSRWWKTLGAVMKGRPFFATAAQSDDAMSAVTFHTMTAAVVGAGYGLMVFLLLFVIGGAAATLFGPFARGLGPAMAGGAMATGLLAWLGIILASAGMGFVAPWLVGGIHHLVLAMLGGVPPGRSYASTVRAHAYANGSAFVFAVIPYLGSLVMMVLSIKNHLEAYDEVHQCGGGKAVLAYFSPLILWCCGCGMLGSMTSLLANLF